MIKISKLADYAVVVLVTLSKQENSMSAAAIAVMTHLPEPTVAKVLKLLAKDGLVTSSRGANGGYSASKSASDINIADIITCVDGPIALTACVDEGEKICGLSASCAVHGRWNGVNNAVRSALSNVRLSDMMRAA